jgi:hypothetical protein
MFHVKHAAQGRGEDSVPGGAGRMPALQGARRLRYTCGGEAATKHAL